MGSAAPKIGNSQICHHVTSRTLGETVVEDPSTNTTDCTGYLSYFKTLVLCLIVVILHRKGYDSALVKIST